MPHSETARHPIDRPPLLTRLIGLEPLPADVAVNLAATLFKQRAALLLSAAICAAFGIACYVGTGSAWYLAGSGYAVAISAWRFGQKLAYARDPAARTPTQWALRNLSSGWATAAGWAAWTVAIPCEPEPAICAMTLVLHAGLITGGAIRNCAVPAIASGQIVIAAVPLFVACLLSGSPYLHFYAAIVALFAMAALSISKALNRLTTQLLLTKQHSMDLAAKLAAANDALELNNEHLQEQVATDPLTGLLNRRAFEVMATRELRASARSEHPISLLMLDIDHFKQFNDQYGHLAGDACLRNVAAAFSVVLRRPGDVLARYGGEEFVALLPLSDESGACVVAQNILDELAARALPHKASPLGRVSASIGIASTLASPSISLTELIEHADRSLYAAKRHGRNRAHAASQAPAPLMLPSEPAGSEV